VRKGYAPLTVHPDAAISTTDPKLKRSVKLVRAAVKKWHADHNDQSSCKVVVNNGDLLSIDCDSYYVTGNGSARAGEDTFLNFQRQGDQLQQLSPDALLPGAASSAADTIDKICKWSLQPEAQADFAPGVNALHVSVGDGPVWSAGCTLPYAKHTKLFGCGPLANLAGLAKIGSRPAGAPLGFDLVMDPEAQGELVWPRLTGSTPTSEVAAAVNSALAKLIAPWKVAAKNHALVTCSVESSSTRFVAVVCSGNAGQDISLGMTFRLTGAPYRITASEILSGRRDALKYVTRKCVAPYLKKPKTEYDYFIKTAPKWTTKDLSSFAMTNKTATFHVKLPLQMKGDKKPTLQSHACIIPLKDLRLDLAKLAQAPSNP